MKRANLLLVVILLAVIAGCRGGGKQSIDDLIIVDVTKSYPEKELILQDFMDVDYIALETNDDFVNQGMVMAIGKEVMLVRNRTGDGDIFVYDRNGKALRKINRKGQGGEEYLYISGIIIDEDNNEMFVNSTSAKKILVYDLFGNFKRSIRYPDNVSYDNIHFYDKDHLICYDGSVNVKGGEERGGQSFHIIISKQDGSITREIYIPFKKIVSHYMYHEDYTISGMTNDYSIIPYHGNWILGELASDTIYNYLPDGHLSPFIVRTPPVQSIDPERFLLMRNFTDRYYFMEVFRKEVNIKTMSIPVGTRLMYDKQENTLYESIVYNDDYTNKRRVFMGKSVNDEIAFWQTLEAHRLVESYGKGELKDGKLNEIAAKLNEEDNPVIMLVKYKR